MSRGKPRCPFCGRKLNVWTGTEYYIDNVKYSEGPTVTCPQCVMDAGHFDSMPQMRETLSRRAEDADVLPCPLCGAKPRVIEGVFGWLVRCEACRMDVGNYKTRKKAVKHWNRRPKA